MKIATCYFHLRLSLSKNDHLIARNPNPIKGFSPMTSNEIQD